MLSTSWILEAQRFFESTQYSIWATPLVVVRKQNEKLRLCGDYRCAGNQCAKNSVYPLPTKNEVFGTLTNNKCFTKLELAEAYQQLLVNDETAERLTVNTLKELYKVRQLPLGVSRAPGLFQRVIGNC